MATRRNKKNRINTQKRQKPKNRSLKKKIFSKNRSRKRVGGHLMGFDTDSGVKQTNEIVYTEKVNGVDFNFHTHSFKHLDDFYEGEARHLHDLVDYPNSNGTIHMSHKNLDIFNQLGVMAMQILSTYFNIESITKYVKGETDINGKKEVVKDINNNNAERKGKGFKIDFRVTPKAEVSYQVEFAFDIIGNGLNIFTVQKRNSKGGSVVTSRQEYPKPKFTCNFDKANVNYNGRAKLNWNITSGGIGKGGIIGELKFYGKEVETKTITTLNGSTIVNFSELEFDRKTTNNLYFDFEVFTYGHENGNNRSSTIKKCEIRLIYPAVPELPNGFMDFTDVSQIDENNIIITMNCQQMSGRKVRYAVGSINGDYKNDYKTIDCGDTPQQIKLSNMSQRFYVSAISEINDNTFSPDTVHEIIQKPLLSFYAIEQRQPNVGGINEKNEPREFKRPEEHTVTIGTQISIFPTIPLGVDATIYVRNVNEYDKFGGEAYGQPFVEQVVTRVRDVNQGYGAVIDGNSKYKIYSLVAGDVVKRIIFKIISIDTASCEIQDGNTTIKGTVRNVNNVHVNVKDANNNDIKQLNSGFLPEPDKFSITYKNTDNTRRYNVSGVGDNNIESSFSTNPVGNCRALNNTVVDLTQFDGLFKKNKRIIKSQIQKRESNQLEDLIVADTDTKSDILSEYGIMESETKQKLLREESYYNLFISCLADYIRRNNL
jgi:hypothetical protein